MRSVAVVLGAFVAGAAPAAAAGGGATNAIGVNFGANYKAMVAADAAGAVTVATNWNNIFTTNGVNTALVLEDGRDAGLTVTRAGFDGEYWARPGNLASNGHERLMWGYADNRSGLGDGTATVTVSGVSADLYDVYAYFGSDGDNRRGTVGVTGGATYSFRTWARDKSFPGTFIRATDTSTNYPTANYAVWTNLTGSSFSLTFRSVIDYSCGLNGIQIVWRGTGEVAQAVGDAPQIDNGGGATGVTSQAAWLNGTLTSTGGSATAVAVYWGTNDQGQATAGWSGGSLPLGSNMSTGALTAGVSGLSPGVNYFYRYYATNAAGATWASPAAAFSTLGPPVIANGAATAFNHISAWLPGNVVSTGNSPTTVWVHYARQPDTWPSATSVSAGQRGTGVFSNLVAGLRPNTTYYYRCLASNEAGYVVWAPTTNSFTTRPMPPEETYVGLKLGADFKAMLAEDSAGAVVAFTNWNNVLGTNDTVGGFHDRDGVATTLSLARSGFEAQFMDFGRTAASNGDERLMWSYLDNSIMNDRLATATITGIAADTFDVYVYMGSDNPNRRGTVGIAGAPTYSYRTVNSESAFPATHLLTTDTGTNYPFASYAMWTNLTGNSFTLTLSCDIDFASGLNGMQLVLHNAASLPGAPAVASAPASSVQGRTATANGSLTSTGDTATAVSLYWGTADAGRTTVGWSGGGISLGTMTTPVPPAKPLPVPLTGLMPETTYYYRYVASNDVQELWSSVVSFTTAFDITAYAHRMPIAFAGYTRPETLVDFPALMVLSNGVGGSEFDYRQLLSPNGYDLRFASSNGAARLNHEVESWDTNGVSTVWVQVPALAGSNDYIWACWGYAPTAAAPAPWTADGATWNTTHDGVWHFAESGSTLADSTGQDRDGANNGTTAATGIVAGARAFNGTSSTIGLSGNLATVLGGGPATFSFWIKTTSTLNNGLSYNGSAFLGDDVPDDTDSWWGMTDGGAVGLKVGNRDAVMSTVPITNGTWRLVTLTRDPTSGNLQVYLDDTLDREELSDIGLRVNNVLNTFGRNLDGLNGGYVVGTFDEVRVRSSVSSADWVWATYQSVASNSSFTAYNSKPLGNAPTGILITVY